MPNLVLLTYPSLTDLRDGTNLSQRILPLGDILAAEFDIAGLDIVLSEGSGGGGGSRVPGPHSLALLLASVACAGIATRTRKASRGR